MDEGTTTSPAADTAAPYNFGRAGQISNDQMRAISMVNDGIARNLTHTLGAWLRSQVSVGLAATEQLTYSEFVQALPEPAYLCLLRLEPLGGVGLLQLDLTLAMTVVDVLMGGRGVVEQVRDVTDIEQEILSTVLAVILRELNTAWEAVGLTFTLEQREAAGHIARLMPASERMLSVAMDVSMQEQQGVLKLCLPAVVLNTIHRRLIAVKEQPRRSLEAAGSRVTELLGNARVRAALRLPVFRLSSRTLQQLTPGFVVELGVPRTARAELLVSGVRVADAVPVAQGDRRAALMDRRARVRGSEGETADYARAATPELSKTEIVEGEPVA